MAKFVFPSKFYIQDNKKKDFDLFVEKAKKLKIGNGMDADSIRTHDNEKRLNEIENLVEKTKKEGAKVLLGGKKPSGFNKGFITNQIIFDDVKDNFTIMKKNPLESCCRLKKFLKLLREQKIMN